MDSGRQDNQRDGAGERAEDDATTAPLKERGAKAAHAEPTITAQLDERDQALEDIGEEVARTAADLQRALAQRDAAERATEAAQQQRASADRVAQEALAQRHALEQAVARLETELKQAQGPEHDPTVVGDDARAERERALTERLRTAEEEIRNVARRFATEVRARQDADRRADEAQREVRRLARGAEGLTFSPGSKSGTPAAAAPPSGTDVDQLTAALAESQRQREHEERRATEAQRRATEVQKRADEAERRATEAERRANDSERRARAVVRERVRVATEAQGGGEPGAEAVGGVRGGAQAAETDPGRRAAAAERRATEAEQRAKEAERRAAEAERYVQEAELLREEAERRGYRERVHPRFPPAGQRRSGTASRQPAGEQSQLGGPNWGPDQIVGFALLGLGVVLVLVLLAAVIGIL